MQFLITGTDSPVSILSFTMQEPVKRIISQGIKQLSGTTMTSPGTNSSLETVNNSGSLNNFYFLLTRTSQLYLANLRMLLIFFMVTYKFSDTPDTEMARMQ
jgi:hypothetical protein